MHYELSASDERKLLTLVTAPRAREHGSCRAGSRMLILQAMSYRLVVHKTEGPIPRQ